MPLKQSKKQSDNGDIRVFVLSMASLRLTVRRATKSHRFSFARCWSTTRHRFLASKRSLTAAWRSLRTALFGGSTEIKPSLESCKSQESLPKLVTDLKTTGLNSLSLSTAQSHEINLLRDVVKYVYENNIDVVILQEMDEETFAHLLVMFKEIHLIYSHFGRLEYRSGCKLVNCCLSEVRHSGLAVVSRWPLHSVKLFHFDPVLSHTQLHNSIPTKISMHWSKENDDGIIRGAKYLANGVQYAHVEVKMAGQVTALHIFNAELLHRVFVPPSSAIHLVPSLSTDLEAWERTVLRLCQVYELSKLVNVLTQTRSTSGPVNAEMIFIGGHFGPLHDDVYGVDGIATTTPIRLTVQDVLQTFVDGLHNAFQLPERVISSGSEKILQRSKSFRAHYLFHTLKSEQLFFKFVVPSPDTSLASSGSKKRPSSSQQVPLHCRIEFVQSKIRFDSYVQSVSGGGRYSNLMKPIIESPRSVSFKVARGKAKGVDCIGDGQQGNSDTGKERQLNKVKNAKRQIEMKLHSSWCTTDRKLEVIEAFKFVLSRYKVQLRRGLFYDCTWLFLLAMAILMVAIACQVDFRICATLVPLLLKIIYSNFFRRLGIFHSKMFKVKCLLGQLDMDVIRIKNQLLLQSDVELYSADSWQKYFRERHAAQMTFVENSDSRFKVKNSDLEIGHNSYLQSHNSTATF